MTRIRCEAATGQHGRCNHTARTSIVLPSSTMRVCRTHVLVHQEWVILHGDTAAEDRLRHGSPHTRRAAS